MVAAGILALAVITHWNWVQIALQQLWSLPDARKLSHDLVETVDPLEMGPIRELTSKRTLTKPSLDGILSQGEWDHAMKVEIDGTDRVRPGVASSRKDSIRNRKTSGLIPYDSNHAVLYLMNDESFVYAAVDVTDNVLDFGKGDVAKRDSVEVFLSEATWQTARFHSEPLHFLIILGDGRTAVGNLPGGAYAAAVKSDHSGYVIEIKWKSSPRDNMFGFDVGINDSDDPRSEGKRNQYYWNGTHDSVLSGGRECGRVHLSTTE